jgi:multicomponent Na+:H+ antiporter subunit B
MTFELPLLIFLVMTAAGAILVKDLISSVFILGTYSFTLALIWALVGAVDVAFVEAVVGAGLATVFFLLTLFTTMEKDTVIRRPPMPWIAIVVMPAVAMLLLYGAADLPAFGDPGSPASTHISPAYLENSVAETRTPNVVTAILMDYRSLDTLVETIVIFTAGIACALILRKGNQ